MVLFSLLLIIRCQSDHLLLVITNSHLGPNSFSTQMPALQGSAGMEQILATRCTLLPNSSLLARGTKEGENLQDLLQ